MSRINPIARFAALPDAPMVSVLSFRHLVDNGDWSPVIQAAVNHAADRRVATYIPKAEYITRQTIKLPSHTRLIAEPGTVFTLDNDGSTLETYVKWDNDHNHRALITNSDHGNGNEDIQISGLTVVFDDTAKDNDFGTWIGVWMFNVDSLQLEDVHARDIVPTVNLAEGRAYGFNIMACNRFRLSDCEASNAGYDGIRLSGGSQFGVVERCYQTAANVQALIQVADANPFTWQEAVTHGAYDVVIRDIYQPNADIILHGRALGWAAIRPTIRTKRITVADCVVRMVSVLGSNRDITIERVRNEESTLPAVIVRATGRSPNAAVVENIVLRDIQFRREDAGGTAIRIFCEGNHDDDETRNVYIYGGCGDYVADIHTRGNGTCRGIRNVRFIGGQVRRCTIDSEHGPIRDVQFDGVDLLHAGSADAAILVRIYGSHDISNVTANNCYFDDTNRAMWCRRISGTGEILRPRLMFCEGRTNTDFFRGDDSTAIVKEVKLVHNRMLPDSSGRWMRNYMDDVLLESNDTRAITTNETVFIGLATNVITRFNRPYDD